MYTLAIGSNSLRLVFHKFTYISFGFAQRSGIRVRQAATREATASPESFNPRRKSQPFESQPHWIRRFIAQLTHNERSGFLGGVNHELGHIAPNGDGVDRSIDGGLKREFDSSQCGDPNRRVIRNLRHRLKKQLDQDA